MAWTEDTGPEAIREFAAASQRAWDAGEGMVFAVLHEGLPSGTIGLGRMQPQWRSADLGYWLRSDLCGRGLMTEAGRAVVDFGFDRVGLHRIELRAGIYNAASMRVAEKLGFVRGGTLRDGSRGIKDYYDVYVFDLLESDRS
jgi:ribosomal-protein-serine acetyltransferase